MQIEINRQKLGIEDLVFGEGEELQIRAGMQVPVTKINAANLPFNESQTLAEVLDANYPMVEVVGEDLALGADSNIANIIENMPIIEIVANPIILDTIQTVANDLSLDNNSSVINVSDNMQKVSEVYLHLEAVSNVSEYRFYVQNASNNINDIITVSNHIENLDDVATNLNNNTIQSLNSFFTSSESFEIFRIKLDDFKPLVAERPELYAVGVVVAGGSQTSQNTNSYDILNNFEVFLGALNQACIYAGLPADAFYVDDTYLYCTRHDDKDILLTFNYVDETYNIGFTIDRSFDYFYTYYRFYYGIIYTYTKKESTILDNLAIVSDENVLDNMSEIVSLKNNINTITIENNLEAISDIAEYIRAETEGIQVRALTVTTPVENYGNLKTIMIKVTSNGYWIQFNVNSAPTAESMASAVASAIAQLNIWYPTAGIIARTGVNENGHFYCQVDKGITDIIFHYYNTTGTLSLSNYPIITMVDNSLFVSIYNNLPSLISTASIFSDTNALYGLQHIGDSAGLVSGLELVHSDYDLKVALESIGSITGLVSDIQNVEENADIAVQAKNDVLAIQSNIIATVTADVTANFDTLLGNLITEELI